MVTTERQNDQRVRRIRKRLKAAAWAYASTSGYLLSEIDDLVQANLEKSVKFLRKLDAAAGDNMALMELNEKYAGNFGARCMRNAVVSELRYEDIRRLPSSQRREDGEEDPPDVRWYGASPEENAAASSLLRALYRLEGKNADALRSGLQRMYAEIPESEWSHAMVLKMTKLHSTQLSRLAADIVRIGIVDEKNLKG